MLVVLLSLLLLLMTNIRAYVVFKANKRVTQSFLFHESVVAGFRDLSELVGPAFMTVESNVVNSSVKMHKLTLLFRRIRRDRSSAYNSTAYKINADDDRHSTILEYKDLSARSMSQPHHNKSVEMFNTASNSLTTIVDINISLPQSISATSDLFRVPMEWLSVQDAGARGRGLFALHAIENNSLLGEYIGEVLSQRQYSARYPKGHSEYTFLVSQEAQRRDRIYVDAADESKSNIFR